MNQGGSYIVKKNSKAMTLLERTSEHPQGNRPRDAKGKALDQAHTPKPKRRTKPKPKE